MSIKPLIDQINRDCRNFEYHFVCGVIKDTLSLWKNPVNYNQLCDIARTMVDHYTE